MMPFWWLISFTMTGKKKFFLSKLSHTRFYSNYLFCYFSDLNGQLCDIGDGKKFLFNASLSLPQNGFVKIKVTIVTKWKIKVPKKFRINERDLKTEKANMFRTNYVENSCLRCGKTVYPTDKIGPLKDFTFFHSGCFRCVECTTKLTLKTYFNNQVT